MRSLESVDSTNSYIKRALEGEESLELPLVVTAVSQTAGRGRLGRDFYSPSGGLYFSVAFLSSQIKCPIDLLTVGAGAAVALSIESKCGGKTEVKWVNDVLYCGKKVCGILCESVRSERCGEAVYIVGIGVNTSKAALGGFMPEKVGALTLDCTNFELMNEILDRIGAIFYSGDTDFLSDYNERLGMRGKTVDILVRGNKSSATVVGVELGGLKCCTDSGESVFVRTYDEILSDLYGV